MAGRTGSSRASSSISTVGSTSVTDKLAVSWSGGKESSLVVDRLIQDGQSVDLLLTTISEEFDRVTMHGVRRDLIKRQAESMDIDVEFVFLPSDCSNDVYEQKMETSVARLVNGGITRIAYGDIHLRDVREYRESNLEQTGLCPVFPLWDESPDRLRRKFCERGFRGRIVCGDPEVLSRDDMGTHFRDFMESEGNGECDPCGENGEFHTFVWDGPIFSDPIPLNVGETIERDGFYYTDVSPAEC